MKAASHPRRRRNGRPADLPTANQGRRRTWTICAICGLLVLAVALVFGQTLSHEFNFYDEDGFVHGNPHVTPGLTWEGVRWALTDGPYGDWYPLTVLSHMLDCQVFGLDHPGGHHLTNLLLHAAASVVLFLALLRMTSQRTVPGTDRRFVAAQVSGGRVAPAGPSAATQRAVPEVAQASGGRVAPAGSSAATQRAVPEVAQASGGRVAPAGSSAATQRAVPEVAQASGGRVAPAGPSATLWPSTWVAAVFAIHPLHVESVAWLAERRDVLSGLFFMLSLWAYARYAERPSIGRYLAVAGWFALGLMSKPIVVTLPCVLLLLDYWPLGRFGRPTEQGQPAGPLGLWPIGWRLVAEKIPLLALSAASCAIVVFVHKPMQGRENIEPLSLASRAANGLVSYAAYLGQSFVPIGLSPFYSHPGDRLPKSEVIEALLLLLAISAIALIYCRQRPYLAVGWFWFLGMLLPVIGLVGAFVHGRADRYTYLSEIGLAIIVAWGAADFYRAFRSQLSPWRRSTLGATAAMTIVALGIVAWKQTGYWRSGQTIWARAVACDRQNAMAHYCLASLLAAKGETDAAIGEARQALSCPTIARYVTAEAYLLLGECLSSENKVSEALPYFEAGVRAAPQSATAHTRLAVALVGTGQLDRAVDEFREALRLSPGSAACRIDLANALFIKGEPREAAELCREVLKTDPDSAAAATLLRAAESK